MIDPYKKNDLDKQRLPVLVHQDRDLESLRDSGIPCPDEELIKKTETTLNDLGFDLPQDNFPPTNTFVLNTKRDYPSWADVVKEAIEKEGSEVGFSDLFSKKEIEENREVISRLNEEYNAIHRLDKIDWAICVIAGLISAAVDILLVGIPKASSTGSKAGPLSEKIREYFEKAFPPEEMEKLSRLKQAKTPFDAQDNRNTAIYVEGLSSSYHRLYELGHDPLLGFVIGVMDIMKGTMTTIDANGRVARQVVQSTEYLSRREPNLFKAIIKEFIHLKTDINTPAGLPAPFMGLFNLFQFGSIGEENNTIAEVVQEMYYQKYDFIQFCASSIPVMLTEAIVRISWSIKRIKEGYSIKESIPVHSGKRERKPKLRTMLFIAHSIATAANAGKITFTKNPVAINVPQWMAFAKYSFSQLKWVLVEKPILRDKYVRGILDEERQDILDIVNQSYSEFFDNASFEPEISLS